jgi:hypothetical protein
MKTFGIILIVIGLILALYTGFSYVTEQEVVDLGPMEVNKEQAHTVNWPPFVGVGIAVLGIILLVTSPSRRHA